MSRKKFALGVMALAAILVWAPCAQSSTYMVYNAFGGTWQDAEKDGNGDRKMCWAGTASNVLEWGGWDTPQFHNEELIFEDFEAHWVDKPNWEEYAMRWWFNGTDPGGGSIDVAGGGNHWSGVNFASYYKPMNSSSNTMAKLDTDLHAGYGSILWILAKNDKGKTIGNHVITCWGFEYHLSGSTKVYDAVYVTDSDDNVNALQKYSVSWNGAASRWDLGGGYAGWYIAGVDGLKRNPNPVTARYDFKYSFKDGDWYTGYVYAPMNYGYEFGAGLESSYSFYQADEFGKQGTYTITGIDTTKSYSTSLNGKVYVSKYYDAESKITVNVNGYGDSYLGSESGYLYNNTGVAGYRFGSYLWDPIEQIRRNYEADVSLYYKFKFSYDSGDYYTGYGYMAPDKYTLNQNLTRMAVGGWGVHNITAIVTSVGYDPASAGKVWVTSYYDAQSKATLAVNGSGTNYLGSESGYLYGNTRACYRFGKTILTFGKFKLYWYVEADTPRLYYFTYTYPNKDKYWGYGYAHPDSEFDVGYKKKLAAEGGGEGEYEIYNAKNVNTNPSNVGKVVVNKYYDSESNLTITRVSASGTGGMGTEKGYLYGQNASAYKFGYDLAYIILTRPVYYVFEADVSDKYKFQYVYGNGDSYTGYVYASPGLYYTGKKWSQTNELGLAGYYEILSMEPLTNDKAKYQQVFVDTYKNGENGVSYDPVHKGTAVGTAALGSEKDYIVRNGVADYFFGMGTAGIMEADVGDKYYFRYSYSNKDAYEGYFFAAPAGMYYPGWTLPNKNEVGEGFYEITKMEWTGITARYNQVFVMYYYDNDRRVPTQYRPLDYRMPLGTAGLGSEKGYIVSTSSQNYKFGAWAREGFLEADGL